MSKDYILAKLLSYVGYITPYTNARIGLHSLTADEILKGYEWTQDRQEVVKELIEIFKDKADNLIVMKPQKPNIDSLLAEAEKVKASTGEAPILFIDYLQLLQATDKMKNADAQTIIKDATQKLKDYVIKYDTLAFIITAYNRDSTRTHGKATLESGRDTSDIEYSSDYILSINFTDYEQGDSDKDIEELKKGNEKGERKMTLKVLKNRLGTTGDKINYDFIPKFNIFTEKEYFKPKQKQQNQNYDKSKVL